MMRCSITIKYMLNIHTSMVTHFEIGRREILAGEGNPFANCAHGTILKRWRGVDVTVVRSSEPAAEGTDE